jgi:hypothetical protein
MLVQSTLRSRLPGVLITGESRSTVYSSPGSRDSLVYSSPGIVLDTEESFYQFLRSITTNFEESIILQKSTVGYFNSLGNVTCVFKNCPTQVILIDSPVYSSPGRRLQKLITSGIFEKIRNCLVMPIGTKRSCLMEKKLETKNVVTLFL